jgi:hypothetical protein
VREELEGVQVRDFASQAIVADDHRRRRHVGEQPKIVFEWRALFERRERPIYHLADRPLADLRILLEATGEGAKRRPANWTPYARPSTLVPQRLGRSSS